jgi:hypothetical protein
MWLYCLIVNGIDIFTRVPPRPFGSVIDMLGENADASIDPLLHMGRVGMPTGSSGSIEEYQIHRLDH